MKKIYTIGRDESCDIVIPDNTDIISRLHATIRVESNNKLFITDQSRNGTYINGMKMSSNVEIPVSRKDVVSLAHIYNLDWSLVPKQKNKQKIAFIVLIILAVVIAAVITISLGVREGAPEEVTEPIQPAHVVKPDTIVVKDTVSDKKQELTKDKPVNVPVEEENVEVEVEKPKEEIYNPIY